VKVLASRRAGVQVWLPVVLIAAVHYLSPHHAHWLHDLARRLFYLPVVLAALMGGPAGGLAAAGVVVVVYVPHAFLPGFSHDPGSTSQKLLELGFYPLLGWFVGRLAARIREQDQALARGSRLESLGQLTAGLAHEIKNPLHAMRQTAELLIDHVPASDPDRELADAHLSEIDRLSALLRRFLEYARGSKAEVATVALDEVVQLTADLVRAQAARQGTTIVVHSDGGSAVGNRDQLVQVTLGIALNALQALGSGGRVVLESRGSCLVIENDGPPIAEGDLDRVFDPFFSRSEQGTGLGLSTAWRIVDDLHGEIRALNLPESKGVRFVVELPAATVP